jgi:hypothetical protein
MVEKHMTPAMDFTKTKRMDWFFRSWVYNNEIPSYRFEYSFTPAENGQTIFKGKVTQSGVSNAFAMLVPLYLEQADGHMNRMGTIPMVGSSVQEFTVKLAFKPKRALLNAHEDLLAQDIDTVEVR